jgi:hypothetical protein
VVGAVDGRNPVNRKDFVSGLLLVAMGLIFLASNLGTFPPVDVARMWPVVLLVIGLGQLFSSDVEGRVGGLTLILTGAIFLAHNYRVVRLHDSWPMFIVIAGLSVMFGSRTRKVEGRKP